LAYGINALCSNPGITDILGKAKVCYRNMPDAQRTRPIMKGGYLPGNDYVSRSKRSCALHEPLPI
jgi:hypothetical protein